MPSPAQRSTPPDQPMRERLQKVLAHAGICSRRTCEEWILDGRVAVNGTVVTELGVRVDPNDAITVDGQPIPRTAPRVVLMLNKPRGYVSTVNDPQGRPTVLDLVQTQVRVYPVGRLDRDSEGLILMTNDGELANRLIHPRYEMDKEYHVLVTPNPTLEQIQRLREGVVIEHRRTLPATVRRLRQEAEGTWLVFILREGRKRQIRLMCSAVGLKVKRLVRVRIGPVQLGALPPGMFRPLRPSELEQLRQAAGLA